MEDTQLLQLWKSYDAKLAESLQLNRKNAEDITKIKVKSLLSSMRPSKIFAILAGLIWTGIGSSIVVNLFVYAYAAISKFFLFSAAIQLLLTLIAIALYLYQLILIHQVDISAPVMAVQEKIARLRSSTLWVARILFLQLPVWTTFYLSENAIANGNALFFIVQGIVTLLFTYFALWLFINIRYENRDKKWFRLIFSGGEWDPVLKSKELLNEIDEFRNK